MVFCLYNADSKNVKPFLNDICVIEKFVFLIVDGIPLQKKRRKRTQEKNSDYPVIACKERGAPALARKFNFTITARVRFELDQFRNPAAGSTQRTFHLRVLSSAS